MVAEPGLDMRIPSLTCESVAGAQSPLTMLIDGGLSG